MLIFGAKDGLIVSILFTRFNSFFIKTSYKIGLLGKGRGSTKFPFRNKYDSNFS